MFCRNCGKELPNGAASCPYCGAVQQPPQPVGQPMGQNVGQPVGQGVPQQPAPVQNGYPQSWTQPQQPQQPVNTAPQFVPKGAAGNQQYANYAYAQPYAPQKKKGKGGLVAGIIAAVVALFIVIGVAGAKLTSNPVKEFEKAVKAKDYATAGQQIDLMDAEDREDALDTLYYEAFNAFNAYDAGDMSYEDARRIVYDVSRCYDDSRYDDVLKDLDSFFLSKTAFEEGEKSEEKGDYFNAAIYYDQVILEDSLWEKAQEKSQEMRQKYKEEVIKKANEMADSGDYKGACEYIEENESFLDYDSELEELWSEYFDKSYDYENPYESDGSSGSSGGLNADGKYTSIEAFLDSELVKSELDGIKSSLGDEFDIDIKGKGNKLIYSFTFYDMYGLDKDLLASSLEIAMEGSEDTFEDIAASLKDAVAVSDPIVVVEYLTPDGEVIYSREFHG